LRWYTDAAVALLSTLILLAMFTCFSYGYYAARGEKRPIYSAELQPGAMHRMSREQALAFFKEFDEMGDHEIYMYQPGSGFPNACSIRRCSTWMRRHPCPRAELRISIPAEGAR